MSSLSEALGSPKFSNVAKTLIILDWLGGNAKTAEIVSTGVAHGARGIKSWNVGSMLSKATGRVTKLPDGWLLLEPGILYLRNAGFTKQGAQPISKSAAVERIVIGHGRSPVWRELKEFLRDNYDCEIIEFNSRSAAGMTTVARLEEMLSLSTMAFLVATAEDEQSDGTIRARQNVVHEAGLFQGRHGFQRAVILLEEGCADFSNVVGLGHIPFATGKIMTAAEGIRAYLRDRVGLMSR